MTIFKQDYFFPKYLLADSVLDTNNQFAKVSILVTININLDSHERRVVARNVTICRIIGQMVLRSHSAVLFKVNNTKTEWTNWNRCNSLHLRAKPEFPLLLF